MKANLRGLITGATVVSLPAFLFWGSIAISFIYKPNFLSQFFNGLPDMVSALILIGLPALVLLSITVNKESFQKHQGTIYKLVYIILRRFSYFTIISSILLFTLIQVFSRS